MNASTDDRLVVRMPWPAAGHDRSPTFMGPKRSCDVSSAIAAGRCQLAAVSGAVKSEPGRDLWACTITSAAASLMMNWKEQSIMSAAITSPKQDRGDSATYSAQHRQQRDQEPEEMNGLFLDLGSSMARQIARLTKNGKAPTARNSERPSRRAVASAALRGAGVRYPRTNVKRAGRHNRSAINSRLRRRLKRSARPGTLPLNITAIFQRRADAERKNTSRQASPSIPNQCAAPRRIR